MMSSAHRAFLVAANRLHHCGYSTPIIYSREDDVLVGRVEGIKEKLSWRAVDLVGFRQIFFDYIDAYLADQPPARSIRRSSTATYLM